MKLLSKNNIIFFIVGIVISFFCFHYFYSGKMESYKIAIKEKAIKKIKDQEAIFNQKLAEMQTNLSGNQKENIVLKNKANLLDSVLVAFSYEDILAKLTDMRYDIKNDFENAKKDVFQSQSLKKLNINDKMITNLEADFKARIQNIDKAIENLKQSKELFDKTNNKEQLDKSEEESKKELK